MKFLNENIKLIIWLLFFVLIAISTMAIITIMEEDVDDQVFVPLPPNLYSSSQHIIGTGNKLGTYFPAGQLLTKWFNNHLDKKGGSFKAYETNGSIDNIALLKDKKIEFGMVEARIAKEAYEKDTNIRVVWPLWFDVVQILKPPNDLVPNYVFPGEDLGFWGQSNSSTARTTGEILSSLGVNVKHGRILSPDSVIGLIGEGKLGFAMIQAGIPNHSISDSLVFYNCGLVSFDSNQINNICKNVSTSVKFTIPAGFYNDEQPEINTIALPNVLLTTSDSSPELVEFVTKMIVDGCPKLSGRFKTFETVPSDREAIVKILGETGIPLHEGTRQWLQKTAQMPDEGKKGE